MGAKFESTFGDKAILLRRTCNTWTYSYYHHLIFLKIILLAGGTATLSHTDVNDRSGRQFTSAHFTVVICDRPGWLYIIPHVQVFLRFFINALCTLRSSPWTPASLFLLPQCGALSNSSALTFKGTAREARRLCLGLRWQKRPDVMAFIIKCVNALKMQWSCASMITQEMFRLWQTTEVGH